MDHYFTALLIYALAGLVVWSVAPYIIEK